MRKMKKWLSLAMALVIFVSLSIPDAFAAKTQTHWAVCATPVTGNATQKKMPATLTSANGGNTVYINFQVDSSQKIKRIVFKVVNPGSSATKTLTTINFKNYGRYANVKYQLPNTTGTFKAFLTVTYSNGTKKNYTCPYVKVTQTNSTWAMPMKNAYHTWGNGNSWGKNCKDYYGRSNANNRNYHIGVDLKSKSDSNVYAAAGGTVAAVGYNRANGNYVIIQHTISKKTVYSFYAHLKSYCVKKNASVSQGTKIGVVGNSGSGAGSTVHLHFAIVNSLSSNGGYYGYATSFTGDKATYQKKTYYNPIYVINKGKLP